MGMAGAVEKFERGERILLLADSRAAISAVKKAGRTGKAKLAKLLRTIAEREAEVGKGAVALGWVKSHIGIHGNEMADGMAKKGAKKGADTLQVTEGGIRQKIKGWRKEERQVEGFGKGKAVSWGRRQTTTYSPTRGRYSLGSLILERPKTRDVDIAGGGWQRPETTSCLNARSGRASGGKCGLRRSTPPEGGGIGRTWTMATGQSKRKTWMTSGR